MIYDFKNASIELWLELLLFLSFISVINDIITMNKYNEKRHYVHEIANGLPKMSNLLSLNIAITHCVTLS